MGKHTSTTPATQASIAPVAVHTVTAPATLRAQRVARVQVALHAARKAQRAQASANATQAAKAALVLQQVQAVYAAHGMVAPTQSVRVLATPQQHAPSNKPGTCAAIRVWCVANPLATVAQAKAHFSGSNYANPATVQTQHGVARKRGY